MNLRVETTNFSICKYLLDKLVFQTDATVTNELEYGGAPKATTQFYTLELEGNYWLDLYKRQNTQIMNEARDLKSECVWGQRVVTEYNGLLVWLLRRIT